ncbi:MAG: hypothetical protein E6G41_02990 [Actinobacteria bacterium]|nr:MAG: hypothetical protein E6G41_02990 [Actinomycetota bacterium]
MIDDDHIRDLIAGLARPHCSGGDVVERAAILAAGSDAAAMVEWIIAHGGAPEAPAAVTTPSGLHGARQHDNRRVALPSRYVLPAGALR